MRPLREQVFELCERHHNHLHEIDRCIAEYRAERGRIATGDMPSVSLIVSESARLCETTTAEMLTGSRLQRAVKARTVAAELMRSLRGMSSVEIAEAVGAASHSSVLELLRKSHRFASEIATLRRRLA